MKSLGMTDVLDAMAKGLGKPVLYLSFDISNGEEIVKAAPYLKEDSMFQILLEGGGFIVCDDIEELDRLYDLTVGDDGPIGSNPYNGDARVYALTSEGNENT